MEIKQRLIPTKYTNIRPGIKMIPRYITIHETANTSRGANAAAHARLLERGNTRTASWHFTCDDQEIIQHLPTTEIGWHAGDGRDGMGNRQSIGIEICVNSDGNFEKAKQNAIWLIRYLIAKNNIPLVNVLPHKHWSNKDCPHRILPLWNQFKVQMQGYKLTTNSTPYPGYLIKRGSQGTAVKQIQRKLGGLVMDGIFGPKTEVAVKQFQKAKGLVVDGIVGPKTWGAFFHK